MQAHDQIRRDAGLSEGSADRVPTAYANRLSEGTDVGPSVVIDTVRFYLPLDDPAEVVETLRGVCDEGARRHFSHAGWASYADCTVGTLRVEVKSGTLYVEGSWPRHFGLTRVDWRNIPDCISRLSEVLGVSLESAKPSRLDVFEDVELSCSPCRLLSCLDFSPRMRKDTIGTSSVAFTTTRRKLTFYDKNQERRAKGGKQPAPNTLRLELRIKRVHKVLGRESALADLGRRANWLRLVDEWGQQYRRIQKVPRPRSATFGVSHKRTAELLGVLSTGPTRVRSDFEAGRAEGLLTAKQYKTRTRWLRDLLTDERVGEVDPVVAEFDAAVGRVLEREHSRM